METSEISENVKGAGEIIEVIEKNPRGAEIAFGGLCVLAIWSIAHTVLRPRTINK